MITLIDNLDLPEDKLYFSIGEVENFLDVPAHTLRYWEKEIDQFNPETSPGGQRRYHRDDLCMIVRIKHLVEEEKFTVAGAAEKLAGWEKRVEQDQAARQIKKICTEALAEIQAFVENM